MDGGSGQIHKLWMVGLVRKQTMDGGSGQIHTLWIVGLVR